MAAGIGYLEHFRALYIPRSHEAFQNPLFIPQIPWRILEPLYPQYSCSISGSFLLLAFEACVDIGNRSSEHCGIAETCTAIYRRRRQLPFPPVYVMYFTACAGQWQQRERGLVSSCACQEDGWGADWGCSTCQLYTTLRRVWETVRGTPRGTLRLATGGTSTSSAC